MYQLIQLSDLECDFINPHDAARNINWIVVSTQLGGCAGSACVSPSPLLFARRGRLRASCCCARLAACCPPARMRCTGHRCGWALVPHLLRPSTLPPPHPHPQLPEYACQAAITALLLLTGRWAYGALHLLLLGYHVQQVGWLAAAARHAAFHRSAAQLPGQVHAGAAAAAPAAPCFSCKPLQAESCSCAAGHGQACLSSR